MPYTQHLLLVASCALAIAQAPQLTDRSRERPFSIRDGQVITLIPTKATLIIPEAWVEWYEEYGNNLHLSPKQLDRIKDVKGEWDADFCYVCNNTLNFERCAAHLGKMSSLGDLQLRVYDTALSDKSVRDSINAIMEELKKPVADEPFGGTAKGERKRYYDPKAAVEHRTVGEWQQSKVSFYRHYIDYGATAIVDYRYRRAGDRLFVLVFMYTDAKKQDAVIDSILKSFKTK
jgi:hypothetical protein